MTKLSKIQSKTLSEFVFSLRFFEQNLKLSISAITQKGGAADENDGLDIITRVDSLNSVLQDARDFIESIKDEIEAYIDARSDIWKEGDRGVAFQNWLEEFQDIDLEELDLDYVAEYLTPERPSDPIVLDYSDLIEALPSEPSF